MSIPAVSATDVASMYPASKYQSPTQAYAAAVGDFRIFCQQLKNTNSIAQYEPNTWSYEFSQQDVPLYVRGKNPAVYPGTPPAWYSSYGDFHASDIQYWFGDFQPGPTATNLSLSATMQAYLINFATNGNPNGGELT